MAVIPTDDQAKLAIKYYMKCEGVVLPQSHKGIQCANILLILFLFIIRHIICIIHSTFPDITLPIEEYTRNKI
jgi:hypothetical protein